jgi:hypothetical protein
MSPNAGMLLIHQIQPLILSAIGRGAVRTVGPEDRAEIVQDVLAMAARIVDSAEAAEKPYTASTVAYYALQAAKSGRRSTYGGRTDALSSAAALDGHAQVVSMDAPVTTANDAEDDAGSLHDILAVYKAGPDEEAGRKVDWDAAIDTMGSRERTVLGDAALGLNPSQTADALGVSRPRVTQLRRQVAKRVGTAWQTDDPLALATTVPAWQRHIDVARACRAGRAERMARSS